MTDSIQLNLDVLLPTMDAHDDCAELLTGYFATTKGIEKAHLTDKNGQSQLCIHYDANLINLDAIKRLAREAGAQVTERYRHEQLPFTGLNVADAATGVEQILTGLAGMLHARVSYAAGLIFVAYDSQILQHDAIVSALAAIGVRILPSSKTSAPHHSHAHDDDHQHKHSAHHGHDHGSAPAFLPHWLQERWSLFLVGLAGLFFLIGWLGETFAGLDSKVALIFYILAYIAGGYDVASHAIPALFKGKFDTDILMLTAAAGAAILGEWAEGAFLLFLFGLGHAGEHYALDRARNAVNALGELLPSKAQRKQGEQWVEVEVEALQIGDVVLVRPGDRFPADGTLLSGETSIDQSSITGESVPIFRKRGEEIFAGTINLDTAVEVEVQRAAEDNTLSRVMRLVAEAQSQQSPTQQFTERFTAWFVPAVLIGTVLFIAIPTLAGWSSFEASFYRGMLLLVAASPCALAVGTPAAVLAGIAQAARNGILIKGGAHLENLGGLQSIAFDKTGTLTSGDFTVTEVKVYEGATVDELVRVAGAVEQQSNHPLAQAIVRDAQKRQLSLPSADPLQNHAGLGVQSAVNGEAVYIGTAKLMRDAAKITPSPAMKRDAAALIEAGHTVSFVSRGAKILGLIALADTARPDVSKVMQQLRQAGIQNLVMLTGDNQAVAQQIAQQVGLTEVKAELLPEDKLTQIEQLKARYGAIAMVGDGVNDAPALATATVGIAMGGAGTAVALETADVALIEDDLNRLPFAVGLSRASLRIVRQNLVISLGIIGLLILSSVLAILPLSGAVFVHEGSTIVVVANALRLLAYGKPIQA